MTDITNWPLMVNNIDRQDMRAAIDFLETEPILTQSSQVRQFEAEWSQWVGVKYSVFVNSGSSANQISLAILRELKGGGEVIVPTLTWVSDIAAVLQNGFTPVFVDINPRTLGMDIDQVLSLLSDRTRAVFLTHVLGYNGLDDRLLTALKERQIPLLEDVCESHGATYAGQKLGSFGWLSNFSFYYAHHLSTIEGGMICTNDPAVYQCARLFRSHGMVRESTDEEFKQQYREEFPDLNPDFIFAYPAYNMRSTEINAVIGRSALPKLDQNNRERRDNLRRFIDGLDSQRYFTEFEQEGSCNYAFTLVLRHPDTGLRTAVETALRDRKIEFRRGTSGGGNQTRQPYLRRAHPEIRPEAFPRIEHVHFFGYYIGNYPSLEKQRIGGLCQLLNSV